MLLFLEKGQHTRTERHAPEACGHPVSRAPISTPPAAPSGFGAIVCEIFPASYENNGHPHRAVPAMRSKAISEFDPLLGTPPGRWTRLAIYPNSHYVIPQSRMKAAMDGIHDELREAHPATSGGEQAYRGAAHSSSGPCSTSE